MHSAASAEGGGDGRWWDLELGAASTAADANAAGANAHTEEPGPGLKALLKHTARSVAMSAFGLSQCTTSRCFMNGCGCDDEMSAQPFVPCVVCSRKLLAVGAITSGRHLHESLLAFFERHNGTAPYADPQRTHEGDQGSGESRGDESSSRGGSRPLDPNNERFGMEIAWLRLRLA
jgi:hypothetical protein